ncbi:DMT family transporter [Novosphingobium rosa]|uniref:DMT family transporter n=1 Tax=Novosphingobium rosa TaxID=76978 RepID=UPI000AC2AAAD|nr:DMT family transporter [Novosphingobium rosa]
MTALLFGVMLPLQAAINARLGRFLGSPIWAASISGAVTTLTLLVFGLFIRDLPRVTGIGQLLWWAWTGGLCGVVALAGMASVVPMLGTGTTIALVVAGQVTFSLLLDHFGLFGLALTPLTPRRMVAATLLLTGAVLIN